MKILVTGAAGFIGFNFAKYLLKNRYIVFGIDNFDNYYSTKFKHLRIKELKKSKIGSKVFLKFRLTIFLFRLYYPYLIFQWHN